MRAHPFYTQSRAPEGECKRGRGGDFQAGLSVSASPCTSVRTAAAFVAVRVEQRMGWSRCPVACSAPLWSAPGCRVVYVDMSLEMMAGLPALHLTNTVALLSDTETTVAEVAAATRDQTCYVGSSTLYLESEGASP